MALYMFPAGPQRYGTKFEGESCVCKAERRKTIQGYYQIAGCCGRRLARSGGKFQLSDGCAALICYCPSLTKTSLKLGLNASDATSSRKVLGLSFHVTSSRSVGRQCRCRASGSFLTGNS